MPRTVLAGFASAALLVVPLAVATTGARTDAATATTPTSVPPAATQLPTEKVSFCHRTASVIRPYVLLTTAVDSIITRGHGSHTGPVFPAVGPDGKWGDVIPPFDYDDGHQHFPGLNWPDGSDVLNAGCAVHETIEPPTVVTEPNINVNVSCRGQMNLDVTFNEAPPSPWTLLVTTVPTGPAEQPIIKVDDDSDLMGFHPIIAATDLPQVSYTWSVDATNGGQTFPDIASGSVACQNETTTTTTTTPATTTTVAAATTTTAAATTTTKPATTTTKPETSTTKPAATTTVGATTTTKPATTTTKPATSTTAAASTTTTKPETTTSPGQTTTTGAPGGSTTSVAGVTTTTAVASGAGTTTTSIPPPNGTPVPTAAPTPLDPAPVEALEPGEVLSDPPPPIVAFVVVPGAVLVRLGVLSQDQVRAVFKELKQRRLAHTGTDTGALVPAALVSLLIGGALLGLARKPRRSAR